MGKKQDFQLFVPNKEFKKLRIRAGEYEVSEQDLERYSRQMLFPPIGVQGQHKLAAAKVLLVGMGALGTVLSSHLVRSGVGMLRIVDRDYVEQSNLQRQMLYDEEDVRQAYPKVIAARRKLEKINSQVRLETEVADVTPLNVESLTDGMDIVLDGTDNFQTRLLLNDICFKRGIPFVYGGAVSSNGMSAIFVPGETCCFRCLLGSADGAGGQTCDTVGVISPVVDMVASLQATEALKYLVGASSARRNTMLSIDIWNNQMHDMKLPEPSAACPTCGKQQYPALDVDADAATTMCGRETVQIVGKLPFDLTLWAGRLAAVGTVSSNPYLLRVQLPEGERLVLFPDGRALVQGTEDTTRARVLYDRYIGS
ncbi:thiazole biosynthesis adenylyltransferase ThiF [Paenibacillaceae bacterium]|nr:thiazole biosynthesis adenylyltransferase ThiF [Paenibacillaceae bacterium]